MQAISLDRYKMFVYFVGHQYYNGDLDILSL